MNAPRMPRRDLPAPYAVKIVKDSLAPCGVRFTTWALTYPRFVHAELMTHREFSRNSASSRAIPSEKLRALVRETPALPIWWGKNQPGMQAREELSDQRGTDISDGMITETYSPREVAQNFWLSARDSMLRTVEALERVGLHKQIANRLLEPWMPITVLVSATNFRNWFHLRDHPDAQPEIQIIATEMHYQYLETEPEILEVGEWHMPYNEWDGIEGWSIGARKLISVGRCARLSYLTHEGVRDPAKDIELAERLIKSWRDGGPGHFSPFEHVAQALSTPERIGNFTGWKQYRKTFRGEAGPST
jgi:thymidylate synthase ThyX